MTSANLATATSLRVHILTTHPSDDVLRDQLDQFLRTNIPDAAEDDADRIIVPGPDRRAMPITELGLYVPDESGAIVAALYGGGDYHSAFSFADQFGGPNPVSTALITNVMEIGRLAVDPRHRRKGLATRLLTRSRGLALQEGTVGTQTLNFDDRIAGLRDFYASNGFTVLPEPNLCFDFGLPLGYVSPQDNPHYRWAFRQIRPGIVTVFGRP